MHALTPYLIVVHCLNAQLPAYKQRIVQTQQAKAMVLCLEDLQGVSPIGKVDTRKFVLLHNELLGKLKKDIRSYIESSY